MEVLYVHPKIDTVKVKKNAEHFAKNLSVSKLAEDNMEILSKSKA